MAPGVWLVQVIYPKALGIVRSGKRALLCDWYVQHLGAKDEIGFDPYLTDLDGGMKRTHLSETYTFTNPTDACAFCQKTREQLEMAPSNGPGELFIITVSPTIEGVDPSFFGHAGGA